MGTCSSLCWLVTLGRSKDILKLVEIYEKVLCSGCYCVVCCLKRTWNLHWKMGKIWQWEQNKYGKISKTCLNNGIYDKLNLKFTHIQYIQGNILEY